MNNYSNLNDYYYAHKQKKTGMQTLSLSTQLVSVRELRTVKSGVTVTVVCVETVNTKLWKKITCSNDIFVTRDRGSNGCNDGSICLTASLPRNKDQVT